MKFVERRCKNCGEGTIRLVARAGRVRSHRHASLEAPATLEIPTCDTCETEWFNEEYAERIDAAMEEVYRKELAARARQFVEEIEVHNIQHRRIEHVLGLSDGYLSKIKQLDRAPSFSLVVELGLIARDPERRIQEIAEVMGPMVAIEELRKEKSGR